MGFWDRSTPHLFYVDSKQTDYRSLADPIQRDRKNLFHRGQGRHPGPKI